MKPESFIRCGTKSVNFDSIGGGSPELTATEIAGALKGANDACYYLATQVILGHNHTEKIAGYVYDSKLKQYKQKKTDNERRWPVLTNMAILVVAEVTDSMTCLSCGGTGLQNGIETCQQCRNGKSYPTDGQKANICRVDDWKPWRYVYQDAFNECSGWLHDAMKILGEE